jgi:hypothetical protein
MRLIGDSGLKGMHVSEKIGFVYVRLNGHSGRLRHNYRARA